MAKRERVDELTRAHFTTLDRLAGRPLCWPEMRPTKPGALAMLFHNLEWML